MREAFLRGYGERKPWICIRMTMICYLFRAVGWGYSVGWSSVVWFDEGGEKSNKNNSLDISNEVLWRWLSYLIARFGIPQK